VLLLQHFFHVHGEVMEGGSVSTGRAGVSFVEWSQSVAHKAPVARSEIDEWFTTANVNPPTGSLATPAGQSRMPGNAPTLPLLQSPIRHRPTRELNPDGAKVGTHYNNSVVFENIEERAANAADTAHAVALGISKNKAQVHYERELSRAQVMRLENQGRVRGKEVAGNDAGGEEDVGMMPSHSTFLTMGDAPSLTPRGSPLVAKNGNSPAAEEDKPTIEVLDDLLLSTSTALNSTAVANRAKRGADLLGADGAPIESISSLRTALDTLKSTLEEEKAYTPSLEGPAYTKPFIMQNKRAIQQPVVNYLNRANNRQRAILRREQKRLKRMQSIASAMKVQGGVPDRFSRNANVHRNRTKPLQRSSVSLPSLRTGRKRDSPDKAILRQLKSSGKGSYATRQRLVREFKNLQRLEHSSAVVESHGSNVDILQLHDKNVSNSYAVQYDELKRQREREIEAIVAENRLNQSHRAVAADPSRLNARGIQHGAPPPYQQGAPQYSQAPYVHVPLEYTDRRTQEAEKIIQTRNERLRFQDGIVCRANNNVIAMARRSEAEKRNLLNILNESRRSNLWNRFDHDLGRMMQNNADAMQTIEHQSYGVGVPRPHRQQQQQQYEQQQVDYYDQPPPPQQQQHYYQENVSRQRSGPLPPQQQFFNLNQTY
jgi:hypothetical protein